MTADMPDLLLHGPRPVQANGSELGANVPPLSDPAKAGGRKQSHSHGPFLVSKLVHCVGNLLLSWRDGLSRSEREDRRRKQERMETLVARMQNAATLKEWQSAATELDQLVGHDEWKLDDSSVESEYRPELIRTRLNALDTARTNGDINAMMYLIRTALSRDVGGTGSTDLYCHSCIGTKALIERYVDSAVRTIRNVVDRAAYQTEMDPRELLEGMVYARQSFGRSALLLSGGATFGMAHIGVLKTLYEQQLLPRIMSGASAGSIVCAVACTRKDEELPSLIKSFPFGDLEVFKREHDPFSDHLRNLFTKGCWSDISNLTRVMRSWLGDVTFLEAYNRTRRICNICVSSSSIYDVPRLLNYITAPNVLIWSAVAASCSVPYVFQGQPLLMKHPITGAHEPWIPTPQQFIDGSVDNDLPMTRLAEMFNVNHFIVSQVNPHVVPFLPKDEQAMPGQLRRRMDFQGQKEWLDTLTSIAKEEGLHRMQFLAELDIFPNLLTKLLSVMSQQYSGDINILPEIALGDVPLMLKNPTPGFMLRNCLIGERATWPKLSRIRDRLAIELALDQAVHTLRANVVFSKSQVNLRRAMGVTKPMAYSHSRAKSNNASVEPGISAADSPEISPTSSGTGIHVVQPPASGEVTPSDGRSIGRRRGSGASIQLVAARHNKPFFQDDEDDQSEEEEDESLELRLRSSKATGRGNSSGTVKLKPKPKPRLRRNAKSQGHMRGGKPMVDLAHQIHRARDEFRLTAGDWLFPTETGEGSVSTPATEAAAEADVEDTTTTSATGTATAADEGVDVLGSAGLEMVLTPSMESQASDGGLQSDADPYAWTIVHRPGSEKKETPSKLRYSET